MPETLGNGTSLSSPRAKRSCTAPSRSTPGISRAVPADDLLDQFLAEPPGQWARAQQKAVIDRAKDRVVQQFRFCLRPQLACILASLQIGDGSVPPGTNPSVKELP